MLEWWDSVDLEHPTLGHVEILPMAHVSPAVSRHLGSKQLELRANTGPRQRQTESLRGGRISVSLRV